MSTLTTLVKGGTLSRRSWLYRFLAWWYGSAKAGSYRDTCQLRGALFLPTLGVLVISAAVAFVVGALVKMFANSVELYGVWQTVLDVGGFLLIFAGVAAILVAFVAALFRLQERVPKVGNPLMTVIMGALLLFVLAMISFGLSTLGDSMAWILEDIAPEFERYSSFLHDHPVWAGVAGLVVVALLSSAICLLYFVGRAIIRAWNAFWSLEDRIAVVAWIKGRLCRKLTYVD